jgi:hypothetical protein
MSLNSSQPATCKSMTIHTVFSVDGSLYQRWQADLLAYSHRKVRQPGPLTRLWSSEGWPPVFQGQTFKTKPYSPHPVTGDYYPPYNKVMAIRDWLCETPPARDELVLLLDPDCVFLSSLNIPVKDAHPLAQHVSYLDANSNAELVGRHCGKPYAVQAIGMPILIHRDDLRGLALRWLEKTEAIRSDP